MTTIQRIIKNPTFYGTFIFNQYTTIKVDGRKKQIRNPHEKWTIFENHHPAIITKEEWEKANSKSVKNKKRKISPWNEFRGLLICGNCGSNMVIIQSWRKKVNGTKTRWRYLKCSAYRRAGNSTCVNHVPLTYEDFREFIIKQLIKKGKEITLNFDHTYEKQKEQQIKKLEQNLKELEIKNNGLVDLLLEKLINKKEFKMRRTKFDKQITDILDQLNSLKKESNKRCDD